MMIILQAYVSEDLDELVALFYETVHTVNARDYSPAQCAAWAPQVTDRRVWEVRLQAIHTLVARDDAGAIVGFGSIDAVQGILDLLFVRADCQRQGIATVLCDALEPLVLPRMITTYASRTAEPFFETRGYRVVCRRQVVRRGIELPQAIMQKQRCM